MKTSLLRHAVWATRTLAIAAAVAAGLQFPPAQAQTGGNPCGGFTPATLSWDCPAVVCNLTCVTDGVGGAVCK